MSGLTPTIHPVYAVPTAAKSAVGFSSSITNGAQAPQSLGAFFTPEGFPFGFAYWEAFGLGGFRLYRSANPICAATIIFSRIGCRLFLRQQTDAHIMSTYSFNVDEVLNRVSRALSVIQLLQVAAQYSDQFHIQGNTAQLILWIVENELQPIMELVLGSADSGVA